MLRSYALRVSEPQRLPFAQPKIKSHYSVVLFHELRLLTPETFEGS